MAPRQTRKQLLARATIEIAFILFLFYANLLMGEFTRGADPHKAFLFGLHDVLTGKNFGIGIVCAVAGYVGFEWLRKLP